MTAYLLDTNIISEIAKPQRDPRVVAFLDAVDDAYISVITLHELSFGLERLPPGARRRSLHEAVNRFLALYDDRILPIGPHEARQAATLRAREQEQGRILHLADALIGATALNRNLVLATRNVDDFAKLDLSLFNPWAG